MSSCPVSTLHIRTLQSPLPVVFPKPVAFPLQEATSEPSAEKLTPLTCELYFGFKLVTTLTTLCNGRLRLCRFLEVSGNTFVILVYASPPVRGGDTQRFAKAATSCALQQHTNQEEHDTRNDMGIITGGPPACETRGRSQRSTLWHHSLRHEPV